MSCSCLRRRIDFDRPAKLDTMIPSLIAIAIAASLYFLPSFLSRQRRVESLAEANVAARPTSPSIFTNASVAYGVQMATFVPFFLWAASGEFLQILLNTVCLGFGLGLLVVFRRPILEHLRVALIAERQVTLHGFMADQHGRAPAVQICAGLLTIIALCGIVVSEVFYMTSVLQPLLGLRDQHFYLVMALMILVMFFYTITGGNDGVQRADQFQIGVAYAGLFSSLGLLLAGTTGRLSAVVSGSIGLSMLLLIFAGGILLWLRRGRFLDPSVRSIVDDELKDNPVMIRLAQAYRSIETCLNWIIGLAAITCLAGAIYALFQVDWSAGTEALIAPAAKTSLSPVAIGALVILPLLYQICDISNWQRLAALRPDISDFADPDRDAVVRRSILTYALETPIVWFFLSVFGVVAVVHVGPIEGDALIAFLAHLRNGNVLDQLILTLFTLAAFSIAISTMDAVMSATLYVLRSDILVFLPSTRDTEQQLLNLYTNLFGIAAYVAVIALLLLFRYVLDIGTLEFLPILIAFYSAQIAFLPLILAGFANMRAGDGRHSISAGGTLACLILSFGTAAALTAWSLTGGPADAAWLAIPAAIFVSLIVYGADRLRLLVMSQSPASGAPQ